MEKWNELCELVGVEAQPVYNYTLNGGTPLRSVKELNITGANLELIEYIYPTPTADKVLVLEEILFKKFVEWELSNYEGKYQYEVNDGEFQGLSCRTSEPTRVEALSALFVGLIKAGAIDKEEVKKVINP